MTWIDKKSKLLCLGGVGRRSAATVADLMSHVIAFKHHIIRCTIYETR